MASTLLNVCFHAEPSISHLRRFPARAHSSTKTQSQEPRISHGSTIITNGGNLTKVVDSNSSITRLLACLSSGCLESALQIFDEMPKRSAFVWNVMIRGLTDCGLFEEAIEFYYIMQLEGIKPDHYTFPFVIKACRGVCDLKEGQKVHSSVIKLGYDADLYICNALIVMYATVGRIVDSEKIFKFMPVRDTVSWNSMIGGYVSIGDDWSSLMCFREMQEFGMELDRFSYAGALGACLLGRHSLGVKEIFCQVLRNGRELDSMIHSLLIDVFGKCGEVNLAEKLCNRISERNVVVWNAMIGAYVLNDRASESLSCLERMQWEDNVVPDAITLINLLPACYKLGQLLLGKSIHGHAIRKQYLSHLVLETALLDMYGKCRSVVLAERVFFLMKERNLVSWNAMIVAYRQNLNEKEAIETFKLLLWTSCVPDQWTFTSILPAYAEIALPKEGRQIHCQIVKLGISSGTLISNSMIHMYAKCGDLMSAQKVFDSILFKDVVSWNTIIMAYAIHGFGAYSFKLFMNMMNEGNEPNGSTFVSLLLACGIAGFLDEGWEYFNMMKRDYGIEPGIEHYGCMLDLLGRAGDLDRAKSFIDDMPLAPTHRIWSSLLSASRHHRNIELAVMAASHILSSCDSNDNTGLYVLLSNLYAEDGRWDDMDSIQRLMKSHGLERTRPCSIIECNGETHKFNNHDRSHPNWDMIYNVLDILSRKIGEDLYIHGITKFKSADTLNRGNTSSPTFHSPRLAICFGLINTLVGDPILVRKNVRVCKDCHVAIKRISEVSNREIVVGDPKMYHHFKDGRCSCGDYW